MFASMISRSALVLVGTLVTACPGDSGDPGDDGGGNTSSPSEGTSDGPGPATTGADSTTTDADSTGGPIDPGPPFEGCPGRSTSHDVFNALWSAFDGEYALFGIRLTDRSWDSIGHEICDQVTDDMSGPELFDLMLTMLEFLDDGHVQLVADDLGLDEDAWVSEYPYYDELYALEGNAEDNYLDGSLSWAAQDWFAWGTIGSVGYVSITSMDGLSESEEEDDDRAAANDAMAQVVADLGGSQALIVDVRANEGGWDGVALDIARWFSGPATLAWSEQIRNGPEHDDFSPWEDVEVGDAVPDAYGGPVVLLTSGGTFSAAETFALAMQVRDDVAIIGERSSGHFSDLFDGELPNGWEYSLSGERYRAADGNIYEAQGVPVDEEVGLDVDALASGQDVILEAALAAVGS